MATVAQLVRALVCGTGGRGFETHQSPHTLMCLAEPPLTLEDLASEFGVSRERIRQIEVRAFEKLQKAVRDQATAMNLLPHGDETAGLLPA